MSDENLVVAGMPPGQSQTIAEALQELARLPVTEACVSGACEVCLARQTCLCMTFGGPWRGDIHVPFGPGK